MAIDLFYIIVPDDAAHPTAAFASIEDAIAWGLDRYGSDRFAIRGADLASEPANLGNATGPS